MGNHSRGERGYTTVNGRDYNGRYHSDKPVTLSDRIAKLEVTVAGWTARRDYALANGKTTVDYFATMIEDKTRALQALKDEQSLVFSEIGFACDYGDPPFSN